MRNKTDEDISPTTLLLSIPEFGAMLRIKRSKACELVYSGDVDSVLIGRRRLIVAASVPRYIARLQAAQKGEEKTVAEQTAKAGAQ
jgi:hypothetical protein